MAEPLSIGRYNIIKELGRGGMAAVFLARDPGVERVVAIKVLPEQLARDAQLRLRFRREARTIAALEHAYIVPIYEYGEDPGFGPYLVMRYLPGGTLADQMKQQPMTLADVVRVTVRLATALDYAHRRGVIHRDLKPKNVLLDDEEEVVLSDFGVAKLLQETTELTASGAIVGTPPYMSPEQLRGAAIDARSDIYSLGIMVYEMFTGQLPYRSDSIYGLISQHNDAPVPELDTTQHNLPVAGNTIVKRALAKKPDERYATAGEFARALNGLLTQPLVMPISMTGPQRTLSTSVPTSPVIDVPTAEVDYVPTPTPAPARISLGDAQTVARSPDSPQIPTAKFQVRRLTWRWIAGGVGTLAVLLLGASLLRNLVMGQPTVTPTGTPLALIIPSTFAPTPTRTPPPVPSPTRTPPPLTSPTRTAPPLATLTQTSTTTHTASPVLPTPTRTPLPPAQATFTAPPPPTDAPIAPTNPPPPTNPPADTPNPPTNTPPPPPVTATPP